MSLIAAALILGFTPAQPENLRLRAILPNGAAVVAEQMPGAKTTSAVLVSRVNGMEESAETHGMRHLVEHLTLARAGLDERLEAEGLFVTGRTGRDAMFIEASGPAEKWKAILGAFAEVAAPLEANSADIAKEAKSIDEELALTPTSLRLSNAAWRTAYGAEGLDPGGDPALIAKFDSAVVNDLQRTTFSAGQLILVVVGPQSAKELMEQARSWIGGLPSTTRTPARRSSGNPGRTEIEDAFGESRSALVGPFSRTRTMGVIGAGLVYATRFSDGFLSYSPSGSNGLVTIGRDQNNSGLSMLIDEMPDTDLKSYFGLGRSLLEAWVARSRRDPLSRATFLGQTMLENLGGELDGPDKQARLLSVEDFEAGMRAFRKDAAVTVIGVKR
jgi:hypothetical protein